MPHERINSILKKYRQQNLSYLANAGYGRKQGGYSVISIKRNVKFIPLRLNALLRSLSAGTDTRLLAAKTAF